MLKLNLIEVLVEAYKIIDLAVLNQLLQNYYNHYYYYIYFLFIIFLSIAYYFRVGVIYELVNRVFGLLKNIKIINVNPFIIFIFFIFYYYIFVVYYYIILFLVSNVFFWCFFISFYFGFISEFNIGNIFSKFSYIVACSIDKFQHLFYSEDEYLELSSENKINIFLQFWIPFCSVISIFITFPFVLGWYFPYILLKKYNFKNNFFILFSNLVLRVVIGFPIWTIKLILLFIELCVQKDVECVFTEFSKILRNNYQASFFALLSEAKIYYHAVNKVIIVNPDSPYNPVVFSHLKEWGISFWLLTGSGCKPHAAFKCPGVSRSAIFELNHGDPFKNENGTIDLNRIHPNPMFSYLNAAALFKLSDSDYNGQPRPQFCTAFESVQALKFKEMGDKKQLAVNSFLKSPQVISNLLAQFINNDSGVPAINLEQPGVLNFIKSHLPEDEVKDLYDKSLQDPAWASIVLNRIFNPHIEMLSVNVDIKSLPPN